jgi:hypothetical protein
MKEDLYPESEINFDLGFVAKKLDWSVEEFQAIINLPPNKHSDFPTNEYLFNFGRMLKKTLTLNRK